jgi:hypothetical protein
MEKTESSTVWLSVCGEVDAELEARAAARLAELQVRGQCAIAEQEHVQGLTLGPAQEGFATSPYRLELLRRLCQIYSVDVKEREISSHRRIVGPLIVGVKKLLFKVVKVLLGPTFKHQRDFNAVTVSLLIDLCNESRSRDDKLAK